MKRQVLVRYPRHLVGAGDAAAAKALREPCFGERKCAAGLVGDLAQDYARARGAFGDEAFADFEEAVRANAHVLGPGRYVPGLFGAQLRNARDASVACQAAVSRPAPFLWRNKDQQKPLCLTTLANPACHFWAAGASASGKLLALGGSDFQVHVLDASDHHETALLVGHEDDVAAVAFSPTSEDLLLSLARVERSKPAAFDAFLWDATAGSKLAGARVDGYASDARWAPNGERYVLACSGSCAVFDANASRVATVDLDGDAAAVAFSPDATFLAVAVDETLLAKALAGSTLEFPDGKHPERINAVDSRGLNQAVAFAMHYLCERVVPNTSPKSAWRPQVDWAEDLIATAGDDGAVAVFDGRTRALVRRIEARGEICKCVRLAKVGGDVVVMSGSEDRTARLTRLGGKGNAVISPRGPSEDGSRRRCG